MEYVPVKSFDSYITANIWMGRLQEEGFDCYLKDQYTVTIDPILSNAIGGIKLCVNSSQLVRAKECIATFEEAYRKTLVCPRCHSNNVQYISKPGPVNWVGAIFTWLLGSYALSTQEVYHCFNCGYEFDEIPEVTPITPVDTEPEV